MRPAVDNPIGRDLRAEVPPRQAFGFAGLYWSGALVHAVEDRGVFYPTVEEGAIRVFVCSRLHCQCGPERQLPYCAKATRQLSRTGIGHTPATLQTSLTQPQLSRGGNHAQLVPTPLSIGASTWAQRLSSPRRAPSRATERASPCSIAKTVCGRPSSSHGCTRTTIVQGSGNVTGLAGVTTPHDPRWTGWNRDTYVPAKSATICSSLMPGRIGVRVNNPN